MGMLYEYEGWPDALASIKGEPYEENHKFDPKKESFTKCGFKAEYLTTLNKSCTTFPLIFKITDNDGIEAILDFGLNGKAGCSNRNFDLINKDNFMHV